MIKKILIIDDSIFAKTVLRSCLPVDRSFEIIEANNGEDGVRLFIESNPDLTFTDLMMPVMDGLQALQKMKEIRQDALVVVCSADIQPKSIQRVMELGAFTMINKPPSRESLADLFVKLESGEGPPAT
ncbi:MAG: response regulator [Syntrophorhabdaceae bacterium]|nr:response regulator [Syntrophorhabdaceae bacterium]